MISSCSDLALPTATMLTLAELLVLPLQAGAPAATPESIWVSNSRRSVFRIQHADNFNTTFLELDFPAMSLVSLDGAPVSADDSVFVTVLPHGGEYGFSLSPAGLVLDANVTATVTFAFGAYGDASVGSSSGSYSADGDFLAALEIWREQSVDRWQIARASGTTGTDALSARVESPGRYVLAAPR